MTSPTDPRQFLYRDQLSPDEAQALTAQALGKADDGELYLQYARSEAFGFDDGRLKSAAYDSSEGFGLRVVAGETAGYSHSTEISEAAIKRAARRLQIRRRGTRQAPPSARAGGSPPRRRPPNAGRPSPRR